MFSECEDDLCIFVCGTCKRYFTQLSAFSQHKKEMSCKKKSVGNATMKDSTVTGQTSQDTTEENETDENLAESTSGVNETLTDAEDNSQRKYPRKQDKKLIKRTIREMENEHVAERLLGAEGKFNVNSLYQTTPRDAISSNECTALALTSPDLQRSCKHPIYVCKSCHAEFPNTNGRVFKCVDCRRGFYTETDLNQHMVRAKHNNLCAVCGKIFPDKYKLRKHELSHVTEKNFRCEEPGCTKSFKSAEDVRTHVRYVHAVEKRFHCTHCPRAFTRLDKFKLHMNTHGISLKPGPVSPSQTSGGIKALDPIPLGPIPLGTNPLGSNALDGTKPLTIKTSPGEEPPGTLALYHSAPVTDNVTVRTVEMSAGDANSHPSPGHETSSASTEVDVVGKSDPSERGSAVVPFSSSSEFVNSITNYDSPAVQAEGGQDDSVNSSVLSQSETGQECQRCQTRFQTSMEYLAHEERRADHVLRCGHCSGKFLSVCELRSHTREQHGIQFLPKLESKPAPEPNKKQRKHFCQECGKGFTRPDKLKRHVIIHSPDRPCIPCSCKESHGCERTFYRNDSMKRHALTHTLDKPYNCEDCGKTFSRPDYLTKHVGHVHKRAFKHLCTLCDYGTREAKRLKIHIRSKHELDPDLFLATDGSESVLGPSMANPGETAPLSTESPEHPESPGEMDPPNRQLTSPNEEMNPSMSHGNTGEMHPREMNPEDAIPGEMNLEEMNPREMNPREMNPGENDPLNSRIVQPGRRMNPNIGETNSAVIEPLTSELNPGDMHPQSMEMNRHTQDVSPPPEEMHQASKEIDPGERYRATEEIDPGESYRATGEIDPRERYQATGERYPAPEDIDPRERYQTTGERYQATDEIDPRERYQGTGERYQATGERYQATGERYQATGEIDSGERFRRGGMDTPGTLGSPRNSESPGSSSPVARQSVISQDLGGVPELRLIPDFQDVTRAHTYNEANRRSAEFLGDQSVRSRFPFGYPPQDMRPQYSMPADFTAMTQSGLTQFPPHQSVFSNIHMQFPGGGGHLPNYERKTPLNSRPVSSQSTFWPS